jgi:hypothetical protein
MAKNGGDPELWLLNFARDKGLAKHDRNWHELSAWCRMLRNAGVFDQLNLGSCVCLETACRRIAAIAKALEKGAAHPDWAMAAYIQGESDPHDLLGTDRRGEANRAAREKMELEALRVRIAGGASSGSAADRAVVEIVDVGGLPSAGTDGAPPPRGPKPGRGSRSRGRGAGR